MDIIDSALSTLTFLTALGCGLIAGVFFAFSTFVIKALGRLPPHEGIAAMQSINVVVLNPLFLAVFVGTAIACVLLVIVALASAGDGGATKWFGCCTMLPLPATSLVSQLPSTCPGKRSRRVTCCGSSRCLAANVTALKKERCPAC